MSVVHDNLTRNSARRDAWYLRIDDGSMYGPVTLNELIAWARQGRIEPHNELSPDGQTWRPACEIDALAMDWEVLLPGENQYGPVCRETLPELIATRILSENMTARKRKTGEQLSLGALVSDLAEDPPVAHRPASGVRQRRTPPDNASPGDGPPRDVSAAPPDDNEVVEVAAATEDETAPAPDLHTGAAPVEHADADGDTQAEPDAGEAPPSGHPPPALDADGAAQRLEQLQHSARQARAQLADTRRQLSTQKAETNALQDQLLKLEEDLRAAEKARESSENELLQQQERAATAEADLENAQAQLQQLQNHYDRLQVESQQQFEALDRTRAELMQLEQHGKKAATDFTARLQAKTAVLSRAMRAILADPDMSDGNLTPDTEAELQSAARLQQLADQQEQTLAALTAERERAAALEEKVNRLRHRPWLTALLVLALAAAVALIAWLAYLAGQGRLALPGTDTAPSGRTITSRLMLS